jgi:hypothetical protein
MFGGLGRGGGGGRGLVRTSAFSKCIHYYAKAGDTTSFSVWRVCSKVYFLVVFFLPWLLPFFSKVFRECISLSFIGYFSSIT